MGRQQSVFTGPAIRSGKIRGAGGAPVLIACEKGKRTYRVFNAGTQTLSLYDTRDPRTLPAAAAACEVGCSVDLEVQNKLWAQSTAELDGIYELVNEVRPVRAGRIRSPQTGSSSASLTLDGGHNSESLIRILNSGETSINVLRDGNTITDLAKKQSVDVGYQGQTITVEPSDPTNFDAIYDRIDLMHPTRSGRFSIDAGSAQTPAPATVVADLGSPSDATYRFFNSGTSPFTVFVLGRNMVRQFSHVLQPEQSFDVTRSVRSVVSVEGVDNAKSIKGIYEYVG